MKKFLMAAIAVFMMAGTTIAAENVVVVNNEVTTTVSENAADKLIALIKSYTNKINAAKNRWIIYRKYLKLPLVKSVKSIIQYAFEGVRKYH